MLTLRPVLLRGLASPSNTRVVRIAYVNYTHRLVVYSICLIRPILFHATDLIFHHYHYEYHQSVFADVGYHRLVPCQQVHKYLHYVRQRHSTTTVYTCFIGPSARTVGILNNHFLKQVFQELNISVRSEYKSSHMFRHDGSGYSLGFVV